MRWLEILLESVKKYEPMFQSFRDEHGQMPPWVSARIRSVEDVMKREDRIVWALRWERLKALKKTTTQQSPKLLQKALRDAHTDENEVGNQLDNYETMIRDHFSHWFSLPIPALQNYVFNRQSPYDVWTAFSEFEEEWKKTRAQIINHAEKYPHVDDEDEDEDEDEDDYEDDDTRAEKELNKKGNIEKIIDFGDGWAWWNLNRAYCKIEGDAMGHCGNGPSARPGDKVLSLRRDMGDGHFRPSLTFILDKNGMLGEMKGRGNEKPAARYHGMIAKLLENPIIEGCKGGGYAAANNFSVLDLPEEERNRLVAENPDLLTIYDRMQLYKDAPTEESRDALVETVETDMKSHGFSTWGIEFDFSTDRPAIILKNWKNREAYMREEGRWNDMQKLEDFFDGLEDELAPAYCDWSEADTITKEAREEYFNPVFDELIDYMHGDYALDGIHWAVTDDGKVEVRLSLRDYLDPSSSYFYGDDDDRPIYERIQELDDTVSGGDVYWGDVRDNFDKLDSIGSLLARLCLDYEHRGETERRVVEAIYGQFGQEHDSSLPYHSNHPDQLSFDFPSND